MIAAIATGIAMSRLNVNVNRPVMVANAITIIRFIIMPSCRLLSSTLVKSSLLNEFAELMELLYIIEYEQSMNVMSFSLIEVHYSLIAKRYV
ncbi:hypothetical protein VSA01S_23070 [Vibrio sagamiensis NBRC 104589]|uniref:Uncharacterized protein n=1 Tax=Vibrio sagamiensis NBRC 104589 TaxID=1219064 RepID=A0A511QFX0_9VIBR|nr:hypothetical protein VSA01S_23070 [Vibrio sagamiensis NBRC 104589]